MPTPPAAPSPAASRPSAGGRAWRASDRRSGRRRCGSPPRPRNSPPGRRRVRLALRPPVRRTAGLAAEDHAIADAHLQPSATSITSPADSEAGHERQRRLELVLAGDHQQVGEIHAAECSFTRAPGRFLESRRASSSRQTTARYFRTSRHGKCPQFAADDGAITGFIPRSRSVTPVRARPVGVKPLRPARCAARRGALVDVALVGEFVAVDRRRFGHQHHARCAWTNPAFLVVAMQRLAQMLDRRSDRG